MPARIWAPLFVGTFDSLLASKQQRQQRLSAKSICSQKQLACTDKFDFILGYQGFVSGGD